MNSAKLKKRQAAGWSVGRANDFLKLRDQEAMLVELKVSLAGEVRQARAKQGLSDSYTENSLV